MAPPIKFLKGALQKMQLEMEALARAAEAGDQGAINELERIAQSRFAGTEPFKIYHGSPHQFDKFDFRNNLLKGEGAVAFGPGGYGTGSEELARTYASTLASRRIPREQVSQALADTFNRDPQATAEYLRAANLGRISNTTRRFELDGRQFMVEHEPIYKMIRAREEGRPAEVRIREYTTRPRQLEEYAKAAASAGLPVELLTRRVGRGGLSPDEVIRRGKELQRAVNGRAEPMIPRSSKVVERIPVEKRQHWAPDNLRSEITDARARAYDRAAELEDKYAHDLMDFTSLIEVPRRNINNTTRFLRGESGPLSYKPSMKTHFDLTQPIQRRGSNNPGRFLYEIDAPFSPEDLLPYHYPVKVASPRVLGALQSLSEKLPIPKEPAALGELTGEEIMEYVKKLPLSNAEKMDLLRQSGLPAMYFLRGGQRQGIRGVNASGDRVWNIPDRFKPDDYNFVFFDDDVLPPPKREKFAEGGATR